MENEITKLPELATAHLDHLARGDFASAAARKLVAEYTAAAGALETMQEAGAKAVAEVQALVGCPQDSDAIPGAVAAVRALDVAIPKATWSARLTMGAALAALKADAGIAVQRARENMAAVKRDLTAAAKAATGQDSPSLAGAPKLEEANQRFAALGIVLNQTLPKMQGDNAYEIEKLRRHLAAVAMQMIGRELLPDPKAAQIGVGLSSEKYRAPRPELGEHAIGNNAANPAPV